MRPTTFLTVAAMTALCVVTVLTAVVEAFLVTYELLPLVSVATLIAIAVNLQVTRAGRRAAGAAWGAFLPGVLWVLTVVVLGAQRAEGDVVMPGTAGTLLFMLGGTVAAVVGIASRDRTPPTGPNGLSP